MSKFKGVLSKKFKAVRCGKPPVGKDFFRVNYPNKKYKISVVAKLTTPCNPVSMVCVR